MHVYVYVYVCMCMYVYIICFFERNIFWYFSNFYLFSIFLFCILKFQSCPHLYMYRCWRGHLEKYLFIYVYMYAFTCMYVYYLLFQK